LQFVVLVHRYVIIDDPPVILQNRGYNTFIVVIRRGKAKVGAEGLLGCESEFNIDAVFSDSSTAKNSKNAWSSCVIVTLPAQDVSLSKLLALLTSSVRL